VNDLCYKSGGDLAFSKLDAQSLIYKGQWTLTISWTGSYGSNNGFATSPSSTVYSGPQTDVGIRKDPWFDNYRMCWIRWFNGPCWLDWGAGGLFDNVKFYSSCPTTWKWYIPYDYVVLFYLVPNLGLFPGWGVGAFGSTSPTGPFVRVESDASSTIDNVEVIAGWA
jgi:hypothetical protein